MLKRSETEHAARFRIAERCGDYCAVVNRPIRGVEGPPNRPARISNEPHLKFFWSSYGGQVVSRHITRKTAFAPMPSLANNVHLANVNDRVNARQTESYKA
jgi:hypothetical protein